MKIKRWIFGIALALAIAPISSVFAANTQDFYFEDFTGDYYLSKDENNISRMKVIERVTAVFPNYKQNKGICRQIPFTNQNGANITLPSLTRSDIKVTRNGESEPIYSIESDDGYYDVCTGTDEYVLGEQTYTFEYEFTKVVTEFNENGWEWQELYWDTNGNGATQRFNNVTAKVHFADMEWWAGESWCYVGRYGETGQDRCMVTELEDGVRFTTMNLAAHENLTFDIELKPGAFVVPEPEKNYFYVWALVGLVCIAIVAILLSVRKFAKTREKARYYKGLFVKPEYQPNTKYSLPEMAELYIGKKKDIKVAMLLDLVVRKKIEFRKGNKKNWNIIVKDVSGIDEEYIDLLTILNNGTKPTNGNEIELKSQTANSQLVALKRAMRDKILDDLRRDKLVEDKYKMGSGQSSKVTNILASTVIIAPVAIMIGIGILGLLEKILSRNGAFGGEMVMGESFLLVSLAIIVLTIFICLVLVCSAQKYEKHTKLGLDMSRYMDGLKLYIGMAEAERIKMLQSVEGADVSAKGIVKLYEKLLPYAAVFGLEESWMDEMKEYCEVEEIKEPDYLLTGIAAAEIARTMRVASNIANTSTVMSSSSGGMSSGFSGGGGGGFSGGGGGGGGFGGR